MYIYCPNPKQSNKVLVLNRFLYYWILKSAILELKSMPSDSVLSENVDNIKVL